jgi:hypothetical protein
MGKQSKQRKRSLGRAELALRAIIGLTERYYNDTRMLAIYEAAKKGLDRKRKR